MDYDPYSGKRKRRPFSASADDYHDERPALWRTCCWVGVLMVLALAGGGLAAGVFLYSRAPTPQPSAVVVAVSATASDTHTATASPVPSRTNTPTPTTRPLQAEEGGAAATRPAATATQQATAATPLAPPRSNASERFEFFAEQIGFPRLIDLAGVDCQPTYTALELVFRHGDGAEVAYFEIVLEAFGAEAALTALDVKLLQTLDAPISAPLTLVLDAETLELQGKTAIETEFAQTWNRVGRGGVGRFSITWQDTARQPAMALTMTGVHGEDGGVFMSVRWASGAGDRPSSTPPRFQLCQ